MCCCSYGQFETDLTSNKNKLNNSSGGSREEVAVGRGEWGSRDGLNPFLFYCIVFFHFHFTFLKIKRTRRFLNL